MRAGPSVAVALALAVALATQAAGAAPVERAIDPAASHVEFSVQHVWVERVTGTVPVLRGSVTLDDGSPIPSHVSAVLDPTKMKTGEDDRDGVLQTPDWFDTKAFPTWTFVSTAVTKTGPASFDLDGTLTIHGVPQSEHLTVTVTGDADHPVYRATGHVDRHAFGMKRVQLDPVIGNPVDITLLIKLAP